MPSEAMAAKLSSMVLTRINKASISLAITISAAAVRSPFSSWQRLLMWITYMRSECSTSRCAARVISRASETDFFK